MNKAEILLEIIAIRRECRDIDTYDRLSDLTEKIEREISAEDINKILENIGNGK